MKVQIKLPCRAESQLLKGRLPLLFKHADTVPLPQLPQFIIATLPKVCNPKVETNVSFVLSKHRGNHLNQQHTIRWRSLALNIIPTVIGLIVIAGWHFKIPALIQLNPNFVPMQYNTALCFVLIGLATILQLYRKNWLALPLAFTAMFIAALTLLEYGFNLHLGLDELFVKAYITTESPHPGRMSVNTSLCFTLLTLSIIFSFFTQNKLIINISPPLSAFVCAVGIVSTIGYLIKLETTYSWSEDFSAMAVHTSVCFILLGIAVIASYFQKHFENTNWALCLSSFFCITFSFFTASLFQKFRNYEEQLALTLRDIRPSLKSDILELGLFSTANIVLTGGLLLSLLLGIATYSAIRAWHQKRTLQIQSQDLKSANEELEEFAYRTSHDLRSPLVSSIKLMELSERFIKENNTEKASEMVGAAKTSLQKLEILVSDLLNLTKIQNIEEDLTKVNIDLLINNTFEKLNHMEEFENIKIIQHSEFQSDIYVKKSRLQLIIENLLSNAIKYSDHTKKKPFIKVTTEEANGKLLLTIEDNGLGIPKQNHDQIFTMFKRFHTKIAFGSGLGLYMVKKSANILGGTITFKDTGDGSRFSLTIPHKKLEILE